MGKDPADDLDPIDENAEPAPRKQEPPEHQAWARPMKFGIDTSGIYRSIKPAVDFSSIYRRPTFGVDTSSIYRQLKFGIDMSSIMRGYLPKPRVDTSSIFRAYVLKPRVETAGILRRLRVVDTSSLFAGVQVGNGPVSSGLLRGVEQLRREHLRLAALPSNLRGIPGLTAEDVLDFTEEYAVSLYLVAPTSVARSLLRAKDTTAVRRVLGDRRVEILAVCARLLAQCDSPRSAVVRTAAQQAITAMENDLYYPAQAIAGTIVDRLVGGNDLTPELCDAARRRWGEPPAAMRARLADLDRWEGYIAAALWAAFRHYKRNRGKVPASFTRHGTVHGLGAPQYSRRSAVQGIMVATSAIAYMNGLSELP